MRNEVQHPFESIESALEFMVVLEDVIGDVSEELREILEGAPSERYSNGVRLALYKVGQLSSHVGKSRRILNDLTLIRSVLTNDNRPAAAAGSTAGD